MAMSSNAMAQLGEFERGELRAARRDAADRLGGREQQLLLQAYKAHLRGDLNAALRRYRKVLAKHPRNAIALHYTALAGYQINQHARQGGKPAANDEVVRLMAASIAFAPDNAAAVHNFAKMKQDRGETEDARDLYQAALQLNPRLGESWTNLGNCFGELGDRESAEACWTLALAAPTSAAADSRFNLSMLKLMRGDFEQGWADYEARWDSPGFKFGYHRAAITGPRWDGSELAGTLYLHGEQGAGDVLMMARYIPLVKQRVGHLIVEVVEGLASYIHATFPDVDVATRGTEIPPHDAQLPMMSLPAAFRTSLSTIPVPIGTDLGGIRPEPGRIGLCWKGSPTHPNDRIRSAPDAAIGPLLATSGRTWQSLQFGVDDVAGLEPLISTDYLDTARVMARCELVITVDTSIAHLAGSLGIPTWILLPFCAEWRWLQDREDSPWYPSARLWRQAKAGDWTELLERVRNAL